MVNILPFPQRQLPMKSRTVAPLDLNAEAKLTGKAPGIQTLSAATTADWRSLPVPGRITVGLAALERIRPWLGIHQASAVESYIRSGEERDFFIEKMLELEATIEAMPQTRQADGQGDDAIVHLHYFSGGYDAWIVEKDIGDPEDSPDEFQWQMFGCARFAHMPGDASLGYICLPEIRKGGVELDFHWTPKPLSEVKAEFEPRENPEPEIQTPAPLQGELLPRSEPPVTRYAKGSYGNQAETWIGLWCITTMKRHHGSIACTAVLTEESGVPGVTSFSSDSPSHNLAAERVKATTTAIKRIHAQGLAEFAKLHPELLPR